MKDLRKAADQAAASAIDNGHIPDDLQPLIRAIARACFFEGVHFGIDFLHDKQKIINDERERLAEEAGIMENPPY